MSRRQAVRRALVVSAAVASVVGSTTPLRADRTWDRGASTDLWGDAANWNPDGLPTSADTVFFTDTAAGIVDLDGNTQPASGSLLGLTFNNANTAFTLQNGTIATTAVTNNSGAAVTNIISARLVANNLNVNSGTLVLANGTNEINGPVNIASGAKLDVLAPVNNSIGPITLAGGTLVVRGGATPTTNALAENIYLRVPTQADLNPISNLFAVTPSFTRTVAFPMTYSLSRAGGSGDNNGQYATSVLGSAYQPTRPDPQEYIETLTTGKLTIDAGGFYTFGTRSDDGSVFYIDLDNDGLFNTGTELVVNNNNFQGYTNRVGNRNLAAGTYNIAIGFYQGECCNDNGLEVRYGAGQIAEGSFDTLTVLDPSAPVSGTTFSFVTVTPAVLTASNLTVTANSTLDIQSTTGSVGNVTFNAGTSLTVAGMGGGVATLGSLSGTGAGTLNTNIQTTAGALAGFTTFTKGGSNTLTLATDASTFGGAVVVAAGTLKADSTQALGNATGNTTVQSGGQLSLGADNIAEPVVLSGTGPAGNGALESGNVNRTFSGPATLAADAFIVSSTAGTTLTMTGGIGNGGFQTRFGGSGNFDVTTVGISGAGGLRKTEGGTLNLSVASSYGGTTQLESGTINVTAPLSGTTAVNVSGGTFNFNTGGTLPAATAINVTNGTFNANAPIVPATAVTVSGTGAYNATVAGALSGPATINAGGVARVTTSVGPTGAININGGRLEFNGATSLATATNNVNVTGLGTIQVTGGVADLSTQNIVVSPLVSTTVNNALRAAAINGTPIDPTNGAAVNGVIALTPTVSTTLPNGNGGVSSLNFAPANADGIFNTFFGQNLNDAFTAHFTGQYTAPTAGVYNFRVNIADDTGTVAIDLQNNGSFADPGDQLATIGCCTNDTNFNVTLSAGQTIGVFYGVRDGGGGSSLIGHITEPGGSDMIVAPGDAGQAGRWSYLQTNGAGGNLIVNPGAELRARTITGATNLTLGGPLVLSAGTVPSPLASSADRLIVSTKASVANVGANHTLTVKELNLTPGSIAVNTLTKTGAGTLAVTSASTLTLDRNAVVASGGLLDLSNTKLTATSQVVQTGLLGKLHVNTQIDPRNNAGNVALLLSLAPSNTKVITAANGPNGGIDLRNDDAVASFFGNTSVASNTGNANWTAAFVGEYTAQVSGDHVFGIGMNDDNTAIFLDSNRNGIFETGEQVVQRGCCNNAVTDNTTGTVGLTAGNTYAIGLFNEDTGGGGHMAFKFQEPAGGAITAATIIAPGAAGQNQFTYTTGGGSLQVDAGATLAVAGTSGPLTADLAGILRYSSQPSPSVSQLASVTVRSGGATIDTQSNQDVSITTALTLDGALTKTGPGRLAVNVAGTGTGAISVTGGTLGGSGSVVGAVNILAGGNVNAGNLVGTLATGALTVSAGGSLSAEIDPSATGQEADLLNVTGGVNVAGGSLSVQLQSAPTLGDAFLIVQNDGGDSVTGLFTQGTFVDASFNSTLYRFQIDYASTQAGGTGNDIVLTNVPVPEPGIIGLTALAGLGLLARRRRARR